MDVNGNFFTDFYDLLLVTGVMEIPETRAEDRYRVCMKYKRTPDLR